MCNGAIMTIMDNGQHVRDKACPLLGSKGPRCVQTLRLTLHQVLSESAVDITFCCCVFDQLFLLFIKLQWSIIDDLMMANVNGCTSRGGWE